MRNFEPIFTDDGYRPNVGIVICNSAGQVFWARRINRDGWQFPQGGVSRNEGLEEAMYRELQEETGLLADQVKIVTHTQQWLHYDLPQRFLRHQRRRINNKSSFKGQKQIWFLLELVVDEKEIDLAKGSTTPEFDCWKWVDSAYALENIVSFKHGVYQKALSEFAKHLDRVQVKN